MRKLGQALWEMLRNLEGGSQGRAGEGDSPRSLQDDRQRTMPLFLDRRPAGNPKNSSAGPGQRVAEAAPKKTKDLAES